MLILALGICATTTIFSVVGSALLARLPYKAGERLLGLRMRVERDGSIFSSSWLDVESWRERSRILGLLSARITPRPQARGAKSSKTDRS